MEISIFFPFYTSCRKEFLLLSFSYTYSASNEGGTKMLRKLKEFTINQDLIANMGTIALFLAVIGSVFFGLILKSPIWYFYTLRWMIFIPLGYWFIKNIKWDDKTATVTKIVTILIMLVAFALVFLFVFGMIFAFPQIFSLMLSCEAPFAVGLVATTKWNFKGMSEEERRREEMRRQCPYEVDPAQTDDES